MKLKLIKTHKNTLRKKLKNMIKKMNNWYFKIILLDKLTFQTLIQIIGKKIILQTQKLWYNK